MDTKAIFKTNVIETTSKSLVNKKDNKKFFNKYNFYIYQNKVNNNELLNDVFHDLFAI